jgi:hypothetical protein
MFVGCQSLECSNWLPRDEYFATINVDFWHCSLVFAE